MDPQRLGASHESLSCPTPGGHRSRENVKRLPWGQQAGEGRPGWGGVACPAPVAEPLGRDQSTVGTDSGRCRGASRGPRTSRSRRTGRGVAAACWTVGSHRGRGPGTAGRTLPAPIRGRCAERPARAAWGPGMPGWAQRGPLCPAAAWASVGSWGGCHLAPEAGLGSEPMRLGCEGPGRAEAEPCPLGPASARPRPLLIGRWQQ